MPDKPTSIDGVTQPVPPKPAPAAQSAPVRRWKRLIIFAGIVFYVFFALWCAVLALLLPSPDGTLQGLKAAGLVSLLLAAVFIIAVGGFGLLHVAQSKVAVEVRQRSLIMLLIWVLPGLAIAGGTGFWIMREPSLTIAVTNAASLQNLVAPVSLTFDVSQAVTVLGQRGMKPIQFKWDLNGDRETDQETVVPQLTATFEREGVYTVTVSMIAADKQARSASKRFVIQQSVFSMTPSTPVIDRPVVFSLAHLFPEKNTIVDVQWDFEGDGVIDETTTEPEITYTFGRTGPFDVSAIVRLTNNTQATYARTVEVTEPPSLPFPVQIITEPKFLLSPPPFSALFNIETTEQSPQIQWNFGDGERAEGNNVLHRFQKKGTYPVTARVRSQSGVTAEISVVVQIVDLLDLPDLTFQGSPKVGNDFRIVGEVPLSLNIEPKTTLPFVQFRWEVPDATDVGSTDGTLQAIYRREGTYKVTLIASDPSNKVLRRDITVEVKPPAFDPGIATKPSPPTGVVFQTFEFDAAGVFIPNEEILGYEWNFGDGTPPKLMGPYVTYAYQRPGSFTVTVTYRTASGKPYVGTQSVVVRESDQTGCIILPSANNRPAPFAVRFTVRCPTADPIVGRLWEFGDGSSNDTAEPTHLYTEAGTYEAKVTVKHASGKEASASATITVTP